MGVVRESIIGLLALTAGFGCSDGERASAGSPNGNRDSGRSGDAAFAPRSDGAPPPSKDVSVGPSKDVSAPPSKDASVEAFAPPKFGYVARPSNTTCIAPKRPTNGVAVSLARPFPSLPSVPQPVGLFQAPGDPSRWFMLLQRGVVLAFDNQPNVAASSTFITIQSRVNFGPDEGGLLGMAFDPNFATTGVAYLSYTGFGGAIDLTSHVSRFASKDGGKTLDPTTEEILVSVEKPFLNHNGGNVAFGPDGFLYAGFGDGGSANDPNGNSQNPNTLLGKLIRIGVSTSGPATIPPTNPFVAGGGKPEIFALGFRNPWRWSFDRGTGDLWVGDVGQGRVEEVDRVKRGGNYGWNIHEGVGCTYANCPEAPYIPPITEYGRTEGQAIVGGYVYRGKAIPGLAGTYVYADYVTGKIWALFYDPKTGAPKPTLLVTAPSPISSLAEAEDGEIYVVEYASGIVLELVPSASGDAGSSATSELPKTLSATGCISAGDPTRFSTGVIPYDVNVPYWADGVEFSRGIAIPDGTKIKVLADGAFELPNGSVFVQTASKNGRRLFTRFLVRHDDGDWSGYAYEWNRAQTDATLIDGAKLLLLNDGSFGSYVTHPAECLACHTSAAGRVLGFEHRQINRDFLYANGATSNQLDELEHIGFFDGALPASAKAGAIPSLDGGAPVASRAKAYLHVNCGTCHRPGGVDGGAMDLRFETPLDSAGLCNVTPKHGLLRVPGAALLTAGFPARSILSLRTHSDDWSRMPPLETELVDSKGAAAIDEWMSAASCPLPRSDAGG